MSSIVRKDKADHININITNRIHQTKLLSTFLAISLNNTDHTSYSFSLYYLCSYDLYNKVV